MGQYYTPVITRGSDIKTYCCYDYDNGAKLMEHSYIGNNFTETVLKQLLNRPGRLAWVGDYAEPSDVKSELALDFINIEGKSDDFKDEPSEIGDNENSFLLVYINETKKEYIRIRNYVLRNGANQWGAIIHPIPLLTAIGNGKGGGDYRGINENLVGRWACDEILAMRGLDESYKEYTDITDFVTFKE